MKITIVGLLVLFCVVNVQAYSNFIENPYKLYPPGCATLPDLQTRLYGDNVVKVFEGEIELLGAPKSLSSLPANLAVYRVGCADGNRSLVLLEFSIPDRLDPASTYYRVPRVDAIESVDGYDTWTTLRLLREPSGWGGSKLDSAPARSTLSACSRWKRRATSAGTWKREWLPNSAPPLIAVRKLYMLF